MTTSESDGRDEHDAMVEAVLHLVGELSADDVRDGYTHFATATSDALRFKWTARQQADGRFIVDETIGSSGIAVRSQPLAKEMVLYYIDERQRRLRGKINEVKRELGNLQGIAEEAPAEAERSSELMFDQIRRMLKEEK